MVQTPGFQRWRLLTYTPGIKQVWYPYMYAYYGRIYAYWRFRNFRFGTVFCSTVHCRVLLRTDFPLYHESSYRIYRLFWKRQWLPAICRHTNFLNGKCHLSHSKIAFNTLMELVHDFKIHDEFLLFRVKGTVQLDKSVSLLKSVSLKRFAFAFRFLEAFCERIGFFVFLDLVITLPLGEKR